LRSHKRKYSKELVYFSFYIIENKTHEREIENVILRAAGPQLVLNRGGPVFRNRMAALLRWILGSITPPISPRFPA